MNYTINTLGDRQRHMTSFERNTIDRLNQIASLTSAKIIYDETLYDVDDKYYVLFSVMYDGNKKITTTTEGETIFGALINAVSLTRKKILELQSSRETEVFHLPESRNLKQAV